MLLDNQLTHLVDGYDRLQSTRSGLLRRWRGPLLAAYAERRRRRSERLRRLRRLSTWVLYVIVVALVDLAVGWFLYSRGILLGSALMAVGLPIGLLAAGIWLAIRFSRTSRLPRHPLRPPLRDRLFPDLYPQWASGLAGRFEGDPSRYGTEGERRFVRRLQQALPEDYLILHGVQLRHGDDVDVVLIGPSGVWIFEVKLWSGTIAWQNGRWHRHKSYYKKGGVPTTEEKEVGQPPDQQWRRMARDVARVIREDDLWLAKRVPALTRMRGGIVFTSDNATYEIPDDAPFRWGNVAGWVHHVQTVPPLSGMTRRVMLQVAEILLSRHQAINRSEPRTMTAAAQALTERVEARLRDWVGQSPR
jgi:hypothetical protein